MPIKRMSRCMLFFQAGNARRMIGVQSTIWVKVWKMLIDELARVTAVTPRSQGPRDLPKQQLDTLGDMAQWHSQSNSCIQNPSTKSFYI